MATRTKKIQDEEEANIVQMHPDDESDNSTSITDDLVEQLESASHSGDDRLLNPNEFKLLKIESKGDRKYRVQFTADDLNISTPRTFRGEGLEQHPFEDVLDKIGELLFPLAFSDQKSKNLSLKTLQRVIKQNKNKEPVTQYVITAINHGGQNSYTSVGHAIDLSQLPKGFQPLFDDLESYLREEISKKGPSAEQLGLNLGSEEDEE